MSKRVSRILTIVLLAASFAIPSFAQEGAHIAYSPYSIFGIGDIFVQGTARDKSMGGVGIAGRDPRYINITNPAAISARDTLSVMFDFGMVSDNRMFKQGSVKSGNNTFNISNFAISFPIYKKMAMLLGIAPYSSVGYDYAYNESDPALLATAGFTNYTASGNGGLYQIFGGLGTTFWDRLSVGAEAIMYFGNVDKDSKMNFSESSFRSISSGYTLELRSFSGKFGVQYEVPVGSTKMTVGATYKTGGKMKGYVTDYKFATLGSVVDTVSHSVDTLGKLGTVSIASEVGIGISFRKSEKWTAELNYTFSDWHSRGMDSSRGFANVGKSVFSATYSQSLRAGFEYIPNRNDIRYYFRQCAYRLGAYYDKSYFKLDGNNVNSYGITLGVTLPIFRWYNGLTVGVDLGQRKSAAARMTKENYATVVIGFNIHDIWFRKPRYE